MGGTSGLLASQGKEHVTIATSLNTLKGIALIGRDPIVMGHPSPSHQWDVHRLSLFLPTPPWARGASINPKASHRPLLLHNQVRWASARAKVKANNHKQGLQGPRSMFTPLHLRLSLHISQSFRVHFYSLAYRQEYFFLF